MQTTFYAAPGRRSSQSEPHGERIRARLTAFAAHWSVYEGTERSEAQTFLLTCCVATASIAAKQALSRGEPGGWVLALLWPDVCIIEMKGAVRGGDCSRHASSARYWERSADPARGIPRRRMSSCARASSGLPEIGCASRADGSSQRAGSATAAGLRDSGQPPARSDALLATLRETS